MRRKGNGCKWTAANLIVGGFSLEYCWKVFTLPNYAKEAALSGGLQGQT